MPTIQEQVDTLIANAIDLSNDSFTQAKDLTDEAIAAANSLIVPTDPGDLDPHEIEGLTTPPTNSDLGGIVETFANAKADEIVQKLTDEWNDYIATYFPSTMNAAVDDWITDTVTNGGTGIQPAIEDAIWQRARDRENENKAVAVQRVTERHSRLGWAIPTGSLADAIKEIEDEHTRKVCEVSRQAAITAAEFEQANVHVAVEAGSKMRHQVLLAANGFLNAIVGAYSPANTYAIGVADATKEFYEQTLKYYTAKIAEQEFILNHRKTDIDIDLYLQDLVVKIFEQRSRATAEAAVEAAKTMGSTAAAALSAQNTFGGLNVEEIA